MANVPGTATPPREIERIFQISLYLLIVTGFAALAGTGHLEPVGLTLTGAALLFRGYLVFTGKKAQISERFTSWIGLLYLIVYALDYYYVSQSFVTASVHLVMFGTVIKMFSIQRDRDYVYLAALSFVMLLSATILTVDTVFLGAFCQFVVLAIFTFIALEMRRSSLNATNSDNLNIPGLRTRRRIVSPMERLGLALVRTSLFIVIGILLCGTLIFFLMPRVSGGYMSRFAQQSGLSTGFSDTVNLGAIGRIQQSSEVVAHVKIEGDANGGHELRLRGTSLSTFDGQRWSNPTHASELQFQGVQHAFNLSSGPARPELSFAVGRRPKLISYRVLLEPIGVDVIFVIPTARLISGNFRALSTGVDQSFHNFDRDRPATSYTGISDLSTPALKELASLHGEPPSELLDDYRQLPPNLDERIPELAGEIAENRGSEYEEAKALEQYLSTRFSYTLQLPDRPPADPIADFLFRRQRGHCEYFASAMAIMLRTLGIPSRVVTGFRGGEFNQLTGMYIVRAREAHSWVEAYISGAGWMVFDPTPSGPPPQIDSWTRMRMYMDAAQEFWREWVVNYDSTHQRRLAVNTASLGRQRVDALRSTLLQRYRKMLSWARQADTRIRRNPAIAGRMMVGLIAGLLILLIAPRLIRSIAPNPSKTPQRAATVWYERMTRVVARRGHRRGLDQTATEFAQSLGKTPTGEAVQKFTTHYERARYASSSEDAAKLPELFERVKTAKK